MFFGKCNITQTGLDLNFAEVRPNTRPQTVKRTLHTRGARHSLAVARAGTCGPGPPRTEGPRLSLGIESSLPAVVLPGLWRRVWDRACRGWVFPGPAPHRVRLRRGRGAGQSHPNKVGRKNRMVRWAVGDSNEGSHTRYEDEGLKRYLFTFR